MRCAYGRLAAQHDDWPALADGAALPGDILSYVEWFYETRPFQNDLRERKHEAVERARSHATLLRIKRKCVVCQSGDAPGDVDPACVLHKALSAVDEVGLEMAIHMAWVEKALTYAVAAFRQQAAAAESARLASLAREEEDNVERERRSNAVQRARRMIHPQASACSACADADFGYSGFCSVHQEELERLCERP
jgi:hypothetical protein